MGKTVTAIRIALAALLCAPLLAYSAGLGRLTVNSALGQPLNAEIEIVSLQSGEEDALTARLASLEAFRQAGVELSSALIGLQFAIDKRGGRPIIRLSTVQPVNEPFLDVLIELQWATGRLVREYTFLLDPPEYRG
ncbi:MAG: pilus assembly protein FimV, partial [Pseudomonadota bacterium]